MKMVHKYIRQEFNDVDEYIKHFDKINSDDTSYVIQKGGIQYKEGNIYFQKSW
jgi:hypothetical protein